MLDLGCGNGRDSIYFWNKGMVVYAVDQAVEAIKHLENIPIETTTCDFLAFFQESKVIFDAVYSRFSLHSVDEAEEKLILQAIFACLAAGGKLFAEVRSVHDPLYGLGRAAGRNAYIYDGHYRRFVILDELVSTLEQTGFTVEFADERTGWAVYQNEDPSVIRIIAKK